MLQLGEDLDEFRHDGRPQGGDVLLARPQEEDPKTEEDLSLDRRPSPRLREPQILRELLLDVRQVPLVLVPVRAVEGEGQSLEEPRPGLHLQLSRAEQAGWARGGHPAEELPEGVLVVGHEVVHNVAPVAERLKIYREELGIQEEEVQDVPPPCPSGRGEVAQRGQELRGGPHAHHVGLTVVLHVREHVG